MRTSSPTIEPLEARIAPATITWDGSAGDGNWNNPQNWDLNLIPGAQDIAILSINSTIDLSSNVTVGGFELSLGTLTGVANLTILDNLVWTGGTMSGTGTTFVGGFESSIGGTGTKGLNRVLTNTGTVFFDSPNNSALFFGLFSGVTPGVLNNSGTFNVISGGDFTQSSGNAGHAINNSGTWNVSGVGTDSVLNTVGFTNTGSVQITSGTLSLGGGSLANTSGDFTLSEGATLRFTAGAFTTTPASDIAGAGAVEFGGSANVTINGGYNISGSTNVSGGAVVFNSPVTNLGAATLRISGGTMDFNAAIPVIPSLDLSGGTLGGSAAMSIAGDLHWTGGTMAGTGTTTVAGTASTISGTATKGLNRVLTNTGKIDFSSADNGALFFGLFSGATPGVLNNAGTFNVTSGGDFTQSSGNAGHTINNSGTWVVSGAGTVSSLNTVAFTNTGTVQVNSGTLNLGGGSLADNTGDYSVAAGAQLQFTAKDSTLTASADITGAGDVEFGGSATVTLKGGYNISGSTTVSGGSVSFDGPVTNFGSSKLTISGGTANLNGTIPSVPALDLSGGTLSGSASLNVVGDLNWTGGTMEGSGVTNVSGTGSTISGTATKGLNRVLNNTGTITFSSPNNGSVFFGLFSGATPGVLNNLGTFNVTSGGDFTQSSGNAGHTVNNSGTWIVSGAGTTSNLSTVGFTNTGVVQVVSGTFNLAGGSLADNTGDYSVAAGAQLQFTARTFTLTASADIIGAGAVEFGGSATVTLNGGYNISGSTTVSGGTVNFESPITNLGSANLTISGGTANFNATVPPIPALDLTGGTLSGTASLTVIGNLTWTDGTMSGTGATTVGGSGSTISGGGTKGLNRVLTNTGTVTYSSPNNGNIFFGLFSAATPGVLNNVGTLNVTSGGDFTQSSGNAGHTVNNSGTWIVSGAGTVSNLSTVGFTNTGVVQVLSGTLNLAGGSLADNTGDYSVAAGAGLQFTGRNSTLTASADIAGAGAVEFGGSASVTINGGYNISGSTTVSGGTVNFESPITNLGSANLTISGGTANFNATTPAVPGLELSGGTLAGSAAINILGDLTWTGGTMEGTGVTTVSGSGSTISGVGTKGLNRVLTNTGTITYSSANNGNVFFGLFSGVTPGVLNNVGTFNVTSGGDFTQSSGNAGHTINNSGTWNVSGVGTNSALNSVGFTNTGVVHVLSGALSLGGGSLAPTTGDFTVDAGAALRFTGGPFTLTAASEIAGAGAVEFGGVANVTTNGSYNITGSTTVSGGTVTFNAAITNLGSSTLTISGGTANFNAAVPDIPAVDLSAGVLSGSANLNVLGDLTWTGGTMDGTGTTTVAGSGSVISGATTKGLNRVLTNTGTISYTVPNSISLFFGLFSGATPGVLNNVGTFNVTNGGDFTQSSGNAGHAINNSGTWVVSGDGVSSALNSVGFTNTGVVRVTAGELVMAGGRSFIQTAGSLELTGAPGLTPGSLRSDLPVNLQGGAVSGTGTITANVTNSGATVNPGGVGQAGMLTIRGAYTQSAAATLSAELGGTVAGTSFDQLVVGGVASLDGTVSVTLINGFNLGPGDTFDVVAGSSITGSFATLSGPSSLSATYPGGVARLVSAAGPPTLSIADISVLEGATGFTEAKFTVSLSAASSQIITVQYATANGTAIAPGDYPEVVLTTLTFAPGELSKVVTILVAGDATVEPNEVFFLNLSNATNTTIADAQGQATILNDDTEVTVTPNGKRATVIDATGDQIVVISTKAGLKAENFVFAADGTLLKIDLLGDAAFNGANLIINTDDVGGGNGVADVPFVDATNLDLGKLTISGNLGRIVVGDGDPARPALKSLKVGSLGSDVPGELLLSEIDGSLGKLVVKGNVRGAAVDVIGNLGNTTIGGDLIGDIDATAAMLTGIIARFTVDPRVSGGLPAGAFNASAMAQFTVKGTVEAGSVTSASDIRGVSIGQDLHSGGIAAAGQIRTVKILGQLDGEDPSRPSVIAALAKPDSTKPAGAVGLNTLLVKGDVENAQVLLGYQKQSDDSGIRYLPRNADGSAGKVIVNGNWSASSLVAGVFDATNDGFGQNDTTIPGDKTGDIVARIASLVIKGTATGTAAEGDHYAITAQQIGKLKINGSTISLSKETPDNILLDGANGDFRVVEI